MQKGKGDIRSQRKRRKKRKLECTVSCKYHAEFFETIDGNFTNYPYAYCTYHDGWLTPNLTMTHNCVDKDCVCMILYDDVMRKETVDE